MIFKTLRSLKANQQPPAQQAGGVLIEALIAILLLSFGLLGMAGLQVSALGYQKSSWVTHRVSELTTDIGERIRSNADTALIAGNYKYDSSYATGKAATPTLNNCRNTGVTCTGEQVAADDVAMWLTKAQTVLPQGSVLLDGDAKAGYVATLIWQEKDSTATPTTCTSSSSGIDWRNCCPSAASLSTTDVGVRCLRTFIMP
jgi:type IV pilus assembly protein PilV